MADEKTMRKYENGGLAKPTNVENYSIKLGLLRKPLWIPLRNNNVFSYKVNSITQNGDSGSFPDQEVYAIVVLENDRAGVASLQQYASDLKKERKEDNIIVELEPATLEGSGLSKTKVQLMVVLE